MGRGTGAQQQLTKNQLGTDNANVTKQQGVVSATAAQVNPAIQSQITSPGYDAETKGAITGNAMEAGDAAYGAAGQQVTNQAARSRNSAGVFAGLADLAQKRAGAKSDIARGLPQQFSDVQFQRQNTGVQNAMGMYQTQNSLLGQYAGLPSRDLSAYNIGKGGVGLGPFSMNYG